MSIEGTRRVIETDSHDTANQYLRFGWTLINHYAVEATSDRPAMVMYVLASVLRLEDTREIVSLTDPDEVNLYLNLGWKLIDKHVVATEPPERRHETIHFVLAWQNEDPPLRPGSVPAIRRELNTTFEPDDEL